MKLYIKGSVILLAVLIVTACGGDYRQKAVGGFGKAVVIMDSTEWGSETADAIRNTFGQAIKTLPNWEAMFDLRFKDFSNNKQLELLKKNRNIIIAAPIGDSTNTSRLIRALLDKNVEQRVREGESFAFPLQNQWYRDQWAMILTSTSDSALAAKIQQAGDALVRPLLNKELSRWTEEIYDRGEQYATEDSLWQNHGWKIRVQHDWVKNIDTTYTHKGEVNHFLTMRRPLPDNDRWFWAWWRGGVNNIDFLDNDWINAKRDSLMEQWIRGTRDSSYVTTEYRRPVKTTTFKLNGNIAYETLGTWRMTHDAMGGPFANLTIYDRHNNRLFILEFGQFAPKYSKRRFVRQFRAMLRTFKSDSTWSSKHQQSMNTN